MTVSTTENEISFDGNGVSTTFPFDFPFFTKDNIKVYIVDSSGVETLQTLGSDYNIPGVSWRNGGQIDMVTPPSVGDRLIVVRELEPIQSTSFRNLGAFRAEVHEDAFDKIIMLFQQAWGDIKSRVMRLSVSGNQWLTQGKPFDEVQSNGDIDAKGHKLLNVASGSSDSDGINLKQAIDLIAASGGDINNLIHNNFLGRNDVGAHDQIYRRKATISDIQAGFFSIGDILTVSDRGDAPFDIVDQGSFIINGKDIVYAGTGKVAIIPASVDFVIPDWLGDTSGDCYEILYHSYSITKCTVFGVSSAGRLGGRDVFLKPKKYDFSQTIIIDAPVTFRAFGNGIATDSSERAILNFTGSGAGILLGLHSGYCSFDNFTLRGTKVGSINPESKVFGNSGLDVSQGSAGVFSRMSFEFWDIGTLQYQRPGFTWSGAYRQFSFCRYRNNTFSTVHLDITTDCSYQGCDFRTNDNTGYILISAGGTSDAYQNVTMTNCMFELLGGTSFNTRGIQVKGKSTLYLHGRYLEAVGIFCDKEASVISSSYHRTENGVSSRIGGGGFIDVSKGFAQNREFTIPELDDPLWSKSGVSGGIVDYVDGKLCNKFTITSTTFPQLILDFSECFKSSIKALPESFRTMIVLVSFDYNSKANTTASIRIQAQDEGATNTYTPTVSTWTEEEYYDGSGGWKRKVYSLPFTPTPGGALDFIPAALRAYIDFKGSSLAVNDVIGLRDIKIEILAM